MIKRIIKTSEEQDIYTGWRRVLCWTSRAGAVKKIKRRTHQRERREGAQEIQVQLAEYREDPTNN